MNTLIAVVLLGIGAYLVYRFLIAPRLAEAKENNDALKWTDSTLKQVPESVYTANTTDIQQTYAAYSQMYPKTFEATRLLNLTRKQLQIELGAQQISI